MFLVLMGAGRSTSFKMIVRVINKVRGIYLERSYIKVLFGGYVLFEGRVPIEEIR